MARTFSLTFHGAAGSVTGSHFLLEGEGVKLLVDCGLEQGCKFCEDINREPFPYDPASIDALLITHAHIDHTGRVPLLVKRGFRGVIYSTPATRELSEVMLKDSMELLNREAERDGLPPLYEAEDIAAAFALWKTISYHKPTPLPGGPTVTLKDAGHVLGSAMIEIKGEEQSVVFTGDLGNSPSPLLRDTEAVTDAAYVVMESVYGDRVHEDVSRRSELLRSIVEETVRERGVLLIPAFSLERTQVLLYELNELIEEHKLPKLPVFLDSPLAIDVTRIYRSRLEDFKRGIQSEIDKGDDIFEFPGLRLTYSAEESREINGVPPPKIIIAGAGMSHGGRIQHHERRYLPEKTTTLLLVGYQAAGSIGRLLEDGARSIKIFNEEVPIRARIVKITAYSAHRDVNGLLSFAESFAEKVKTVFVVMGETKSTLFLVQRLRDYLGVHAVAPKRGERVSLEL